MAREIVGKIQSYDVLYIAEKDIIFCKNTAVAFPILERAYKQGNLLTKIEDKKLTIIQDGDTVNLGCLLTSRSNCGEIINAVNKIKNQEKHVNKKKACGHQICLEAESEKV